MHIMPMSRSDRVNLDNLDKYLDLLRDMHEIKAAHKAAELCWRP
jgi:hypothetical protein